LRADSTAARASGPSSRRTEQAAVRCSMPLRNERDAWRSLRARCAARDAPRAPPACHERRRDRSVTLHQLFTRPSTITPASAGPEAGASPESPVQRCGLLEVLESPGPPYRQSSEASRLHHGSEQHELGESRSGASTARRSSSARVKRSPLRRVTNTSPSRCSRSRPWRASSSTALCRPEAVVESLEHPRSGRPLGAGGVRAQHHEPPGPSKRRSSARRTRPPALPRRFGTSAPAIRSPGA